MHECICHILHTRTSAPIHIAAQIKTLPSTGPKKMGKRGDECSVAFLRLHSCDDGSVKWLLATRRRQPTLILRVLFVNVAVAVVVLAALHRKCRYCYQLSTMSPPAACMHTHTRTHTSPSHTHTHTRVYVCQVAFWSAPGAGSPLRWRLPLSGKLFYVCYRIVRLSMCFSFFFVLYVFFFLHALHHFRMPFIWVALFFLVQLCLWA